MNKVALAGNPNSGKSTIFNLLTGLRQKISNFPGVTVEKKTGSAYLDKNTAVQVTDLPGTYSLFPNSLEEKIVVDILTDPDNENYPDLVVYVADITQLERHLMLALQIQQLGLPMIFVANMTDLLENEPDTGALESFLKVPVVVSNSKQTSDLINIKNCIKKYFDNDDQNKQSFSNRRSLPFTDDEAAFFREISTITGNSNLYHGKILAHHADWINIPDNQRASIQKIRTYHDFKNMDQQVKEVMYLYDQFLPVIQNIIPKNSDNKHTALSSTDKILTHRWAGPLIFFTIMLFVFQAIYAWATYPMDWIETAFTGISAWLSDILPPHFLTDLLINGLLAGLSGVVVFIPQIAILFILITLLEESGYMSRAVYMFDSIMQKFGMNGRSVVALVSSGACAIPAIMSTRTIQNQKERLITILVSPLISCSARLPVYAVLVGFVVPDIKVWGFLNAPGLVFMGLYFLGILAALASAFVISGWMKGTESSYLMLEIPAYKKPNWHNVWVTTREKVLSFVREAGKIIMIISVILWAMSSFGPGQNMDKAEKDALTYSEANRLSEEDKTALISQYKLEASYAGIAGKWLEPAIQPLGFDWKIGIALITSFAAREVFVGTMATIYSIGQDDETATLREKMKKEKKKDGITPMYNTATALSLLIFYVFALQCMSTLAVTKKETGSWKWPVLQFGFMGILAYLGSLIVYTVLG
jgi:ferrous iron transport protein B